MFTTKIFAVIILHLSKKEIKDFDSPARNFSSSFLRSTKMSSPEAMNILYDVLFTRFNTLSGSNVLDAN